MFRFILLFLLIVMVGCSSKNVEIDFDPEFKTDALMTFSVFHKTDDYNALNNERIIGAIIDEMEKKGYVNTAENVADFHITFISSIQKDVPSNVGIGLGLGTFSSGLGLSLGTVSAFSSDQGTIFISMIDPKTQKIFWYAKFTKKIDDFESPQERTKYFNELVSTMLRDFPAR